MLKSFEQMDYHPMSESLVKILQTKTQNNNPLFFRIIVAYYMAMIASQMRINISGWYGSKLPINLYALALSPSGTGKGHSTTLIEESVINNFSSVFLEHTFPIQAQVHCDKLALKRATRNGTNQEDELIKLGKDFQALGAMMMDFDDATVPAIKQFRQKLLMANAGSLNLRVDEIGANFTKIVEALLPYLELFDKGLLKDKLVKSSSDNVRFERINGYTPANLLMFGTPSKLLDGGKTEELLFEMLEMGYARRCFFGFAEKPNKKANQSIDEIMEQMFNQDDDDVLEKISIHLGTLADLKYINQTIKLSTDATKLLIAYKLHCEERSRELSELAIINKSELEHRYYKVLKLAGAYAFIDEMVEIPTTHIEYAIKLAEDSGEAFAKLMTPQRPYIKLANYLAMSKNEVTLADLDTDLPFFRGSKAQKDELITMATAWGYKNQIVVKKSFVDSIMFLHADTINKTDLDKCILSYTTAKDGDSTGMTTNYKNTQVPFDKLGELFKLPDKHWLNHHVKDGYRKEDNAIGHFNLLVLDVDGSINLSTAMLLLKGYKAWYYTTKRHTEQTNRFRIVLPTNYVLSLDANDYKEFYNNVLKDIPFEIDNGCGHRTKKWLSNPKAEVFFTDGELFDVLPYIPKSSENEKREQRLTNQQDLDNLERWVINNTGDGNRNNMLYNYAMVLADAGFNFEHIKDKVITLNAKMMDKLDEVELHNTIFHSVAGKLSQQGKLY